jgi:hypothetical protein
VPSALAEQGRGTEQNHRKPNSDDQSDEDRHELISHGPSFASSFTMADRSRAA